MLRLPRGGAGELARAVALDLGRFLGRSVPAGRAGPGVAAFLATTIGAAVDYDARRRPERALEIQLALRLHRLRS